MVTKYVGKDKDFVFLVIGPYCRGKGPTEAIARKLAQKNAPKAAGMSIKNYQVYLVPPDATINDMGDIVCDSAEAPIILIRTVKDGKDQIS